MNYDKDELSQYFFLYSVEYFRRYNKSLNKYLEEFNIFSLGRYKALRPYRVTHLFLDWHNEEYLRICMANLYEKFYYAIGKSKISYEEWSTLETGYYIITGKEYQI